MAYVSCFGDESPSEALLNPALKTPIEEAVGGETVAETATQLLNVVPDNTSIVLPDSNLLSHPAAACDDLLTSASVEEVATSTETAAAFPQSPFAATGTLTSAKATSSCSVVPAAVISDAARPEARQDQAVTAPGAVAEDGSHVAEGIKAEKYGPGGVEWSSPLASGTSAGAADLPAACLLTIYAYTDELQRLLYGRSARTVGPVGAFQEKHTRQQQPKSQQQQPQSQQQQPQSQQEEQPPQQVHSGQQQLRGQPRPQRLQQQQVQEQQMQRSLSREHGQRGLGGCEGFSFSRSDADAACSARHKGPRSLLHCSSIIVLNRWTLYHDATTRVHPSCSGSNRQTPSTVFLQKQQRMCTSTAACPSSSFSSHTGSFPPVAGGGGGCVVAAGRGGNGGTAGGSSAAASGCTNANLAVSSVGEKEVVQRAAAGAAVSSLETSTWQMDIAISSAAGSNKTAPSHRWNMLRPFPVASGLPSTFSAPPPRTHFPLGIIMQQLDSLCPAALLLLASRIKQRLPAALHAVLHDVNELSFPLPQQETTELQEERSDAQQQHCLIQQHQDQKYHQAQQFPHQQQHLQQYQHQHQGQHCQLQQQQLHHSWERGQHTQYARSQQYHKQQQPPHQHERQQGQQHIPHQQKQPSQHEQQQQQQHNSHYHAQEQHQARRKSLLYYSQHQEGDFAVEQQQHQQQQCIHNISVERPFIFTQHTSFTNAEQLLQPMPQQQQQPPRSHAQKHLQQQQPEQLRCGRDTGAARRAVSPQAVEARSFETGSSLQGISSAASFCQQSEAVNVADAGAADAPDTYKNRTALACPLAAYSSVIPAATATGDGATAAATATGDAATAAAKAARDTIGAGAAEASQDAVGAVEDIDDALEELEQQLTTMQLRTTLPPLRDVVLRPSSSNNFLAPAAPMTPRVEPEEYQKSFLLQQKEYGQQTSCKQHSAEQQQQQRRRLQQQSGKQQQQYQQQHPQGYIHQHQPRPQLQEMMHHQEHNTLQKGHCQQHQQQHILQEERRPEQQQDLRNEQEILFMQGHVKEPNFELQPHRHRQLEPSGKQQPFYNLSMWQQEGRQVQHWQQQHKHQEQHIRQQQQENNQEQISVRDTDRRVQTLRSCLVEEEQQQEDTRATEKHIQQQQTRKLMHPSQQQLLLYGVRRMPREGFVVAAAGQETRSSWLPTLDSQVPGCPSQQNESTSSVQVPEFSLQKDQLGNIHSIFRNQPNVLDKSFDTVAGAPAVAAAPTDNSYCSTGGCRNQSSQRDFSCAVGETTEQQQQQQQRHDVQQQQMHHGQQQVEQGRYSRQQQALHNDQQCHYQHLHQQRQQQNQQQQHQNQGLQEQQQQKKRQQQQQQDQQQRQQNYQLQEQQRQQLQNERSQEQQHHEIQNQQEQRQSVLSEGLQQHFHRKGEEEDLGRRQHQQEQLKLIALATDVDEELQMKRLGLPVSFASTTFRRKSITPATAVAGADAAVKIGTSSSAGCDHIHCSTTSRGCAGIAGNTTGLLQQPYTRLQQQQRQQQQHGYPSQQYLRQQQQQQSYRYPQPQGVLERQKIRFMQSRQNMNLDCLPSSSEHCCDGGKGEDLSSSLKAHRSGKCDAAVSWSSCTAESVTGGGKQYRCGSGTTLWHYKGNSEEAMRVSHSNCRSDIRPSSCSSNSGNTRMTCGCGTVAEAFLRYQQYLHTKQHNLSSPISLPPVAKGSAGAASPRSNNNNVDYTEGTTDSHSGDIGIAPKTVLTEEETCLETARKQDDRTSCGDIPINKNYDVERSGSLDFWLEDPSEIARRLPISTFATPGHYDNIGNTTESSYYRTPTARFHKYTEGVLLDDAGWFEVTEESVARYTADVLREVSAFAAACAGIQNKIQKPCGAFPRGSRDWNSYSHSGNSTPSRRRRGKERNCCDAETADSIDSKPTERNNTCAASNSNGKKQDYRTRAYSDTSTVSNKNNSSGNSEKGDNSSNILRCGTAAVSNSSFIRRNSRIGSDRNTMRSCNTDGSHSSSIKCSTTTRNGSYSDILPSSNSVTGHNSSLHSRNIVNENNSNNSLRSSSTAPSCSSSSTFRSSSTIRSCSRSSASSNAYAEQSSSTSPAGTRDARSYMYSNSGTSPSSSSGSSVRRKKNINNEVALDSSRTELTEEGEEGIAITLGGRSESMRGSFENTLQQEADMKTGTAGAVSELIRTTEQEWYGPVQRQQKLHSEQMHYQDSDSKRQKCMSDKSSHARSRRKAANATKQLSLCSTGCSNQPMVSAVQHTTTFSSSSCSFSAPVSSRLSLSAASVVPLGCAMASPITPVDSKAFPVDEACAVDAAAYAAGTPERDPLVLSPALSPGTASHASCAAAVAASASDEAASVVVAADSPSVASTSSHTSSVAAASSDTPSTVVAASLEATPVDASFSSHATPVVAATSSNSTPVVAPISPSDSTAGVAATSSLGATSRVTAVSSKSNPGVAAAVECELSSVAVPSPPAAAPLVAMDCCCGVGGNVIQFASLFDACIGVDCDFLKLAICSHNSSIYNVREKVYLYLDTLQQWLEKRQAARYVPLLTYRQRYVARTAVADAAPPTASAAKPREPAGSGAVTGTRPPATAAEAIGAAVVEARASAAPVVSIPGTSTALAGVTMAGATATGVNLNAREYSDSGVVDPTECVDGGENNPENVTCYGAPGEAGDDVSITAIDVNDARAQTALISVTPVTAKVCQDDMSDSSASSQQGKGTILQQENVQQQQQQQRRKKRQKRRYKQQQQRQQHMQRQQLQKKKEEKTDAEEEVDTRASMPDQYKAGELIPEYPMLLLEGRSSRKEASNIKSRTARLPLSTERQVRCWCCKEFSNITCWECRMRREDAYVVQEAGGGGSAQEATGTSQALERRSRTSAANAICAVRKDAHVPTETIKRRDNPSISAREASSSLLTTVVTAAQDAEAETSERENSTVIEKAQRRHLSSARIVKRLHASNMSVAPVRVGAVPPASEGSSDNGQCSSAHFPRRYTQEEMLIADIAWAFMSPPWGGPSYIGRRAPEEELYSIASADPEHLGDAAATPIAVDSGKTLALKGNEIKNTTSFAAVAPASKDSPSATSEVRVADTRGGERGEEVPDVRTPEITTQEYTDLPSSIPSLVKAAARQVLLTRTRSLQRDIS